MTTKNSLLLFLLFILGSLLFQIPLLHQLITVSSRNDYSSHILLIPLISSFLLFRNRAEIFSKVRFSILGGAAMMLIAFSVYLSAYRMREVSSESDLVSLQTLALVLLWMGGFLFFLGEECLRKGLFPVFFLFLTVPIPQLWVQEIVTFLQKGSAEAVGILFQLIGTPHHRQDTVFMLPGINIEIAPECSGIRSSLALFITTLLAGHLMLETWWRKLLLVLIGIPMAFMKNAIRIVTLSLLAVYVDPRWLTGSDLHHRGGVVFFLIALGLMAPILWVLMKTEKRNPMDRKSKTD